MHRALLFRQLKRGSRGKKYSPQLRTFALTLNFYSSSAYQYVRRVFGKNSLPHPRTLAKWYSTIDGTPGYSAEALRAVSIKVATEKKKGKELVAGLVMDEMSIHQHVHWTGSRSVGYVDFGTGMQDSDQLPEAKNVLVIMLVGYNSRWKVPIAYFLIDSLSAEENAKLISGCFLQMEKTGVLIKSLTFDGCPTNISMANSLGAKLGFPDIKPYFVNQLNNEKVHIILDACHMVKLVRNTLGDWGILYGGDGCMIRWSYFKELLKVQDDSGLHCATRLRSRHINYFKEKMKVKLAVQTFSNSVADALNYCNKDLNIPCFQNSEATANFCRKINDIFDFLNVRNFYGKTFCKRPLFKGSHEFVENFVNESVEYLSSLKDGNGNLILLTGRKTGFLGLIVCLLSVKNLYIDLVVGCKLDFFLTYKLSQDHLEMFFSAIRSRGGFSNNPTAWHFEMAYNRLLIHSEVATSDSANCLAQDNTSILNVSSKNNTENNSTADLLLEINEFADVDQDTFIKNYSNVSNCLYITDVVEYIAGFISRKLTRVLSCNECANAVTAENSLSLLLRRKDRGGLCKPSRDVVKICVVAETVIKSETNFSLPNILIKLISQAIRKLSLNTLFAGLENHFKEQDPLNTHHIQIIRLILKNYFNIRIHHINATKNEPRSRIRQHLTKTIIFSHQ